MKLAFYKPTKTAAGIAEPVYTGYRSKYFGDHNQPENALKDFPKHRCHLVLEPSRGNLEKLLLKFTSVGSSAIMVCAKTDIKYNMVAAIKFIEPQGFYFAAADLIICDAADYFAEASAIILCNLKKNGKAILRIKYAAEYLDLITAISQHFITINIAAGYIVLQKYVPPKSDKLLNFLQYFIDGGNICYYEKNPDRKQLQEKIKQVKMSN